MKYGRTYHFPFSPGTTSDDRINREYWTDIQEIETLVHTEKLDGENNCLNRYGVFARSHAAPTISPWTKQIRQQWELIKNDLGDIELFGENLYAVHSIKYRQLETYFFVFAVRYMDTWLAWDEVKFYAALFGFPTVPELAIRKTESYTEDSLQEDIIRMAREPSIYCSYDIHTEAVCSREGIVSRNICEYPVDCFARNVFKYVRKGHVKTDEHWTRQWRRAELLSEMLE